MSAVPGEIPTSPLTTVDPVFVTVEPARMAKLLAVPRLTVAGEVAGFDPAPGALAAAARFTGSAMSAPPPAQPAKRIAASAAATPRTVMR